MSVGDDYETDKYLITVDSEMTAAQQAPAASVKKDIVTAADTATDSTVSTDRPVVPAITNKLAGRSRKVSLKCWSKVTCNIIFDTKMYVYVLS